MDAAKHLRTEPAAAVVDLRLHFDRAGLRVHGVRDPRYVSFDDLAGIGEERDLDELLRLNEPDVCLGHLRRHPHRAQVGDGHHGGGGVVAEFARHDAQLEDLAREGRSHDDRLSEAAGRESQNGEPSPRLFARGPRLIQRRLSLGQRVLGIERLFFRDRVVLEEIPRPVGVGLRFGQCRARLRHGGLGLEVRGHRGVGVRTVQGEQRLLLADGIADFDENGRDPSRGRRHHLRDTVRIRLDLAGRDHLVGGEIGDVDRFAAHLLQDRRARRQRDRSRREGRRDFLGRGVRSTTTDCPGRQHQQTDNSNG